MKSFFDYLNAPMYVNDLDLELWPIVQLVFLKLKLNHFDDDQEIPIVYQHDQQIDQNMEFF